MFVFGCQHSFLRKYKRKFLKSSLIAVRQFHIRFVLQRSFFYNVYHAIYLSISHENEDLDKEKQSYMPITIHLVYQKSICGSNNISETSISMRKSCFDQIENI